MSYPLTPEMARRWRDQTPKQIPTVEKIVPVEPVKDTEDGLHDADVTQGGTLLTTITDAKGKKILMPRNWTVASLAKNIMNFVNTNKVCNVQALGISGSGKTTAFKSIIHYIHTHDPTFIILWFSGEDMLQIPKITKRLAKKRNYIFVWDDLSFIEQKFNLSKSELAEIQNTMTTLRHDLGEKSKVINFSALHYSKAVSKSSSHRMSHFSIATSIVNNEKLNMLEIFSKEGLDTFSRLYRKSMLHGKFSMKTDAWSGKELWWLTEDCHPVLVNEINYSHIMLVNPVECEICNKDKYNSGKKIILNAKEFCDLVPYNDKQISKTMRWWSYMRTGNEKFLKPMDRKFIQALDKLSERMDIPYEEIMDEQYSRLAIDIHKEAIIRKKDNQAWDQVFKKVQRWRGKLVPEKEYWETRKEEIQQRLDELDQREAGKKEVLDVSN